MKLSDIVSLEYKDGKPYYDGSLDLRGTAVTSLPAGLTVGGSLVLSGTAITSLPEGLTVGGLLDLENSSITSLSEGLTVGGWLDIGGIGITSLPDGLTVGGWLDISGTKIISLPEGLTVGGCLVLSGTITSLPDDITVGGDIYTNGTSIPDTTHVNKNVPNPLLWKNGKYIKVDGIFSEVIEHKGNIYKIRQIASNTDAYVVTDGQGKWAHGDTIKEAKADLIYKISNRDKSAYEHLTLDSELTFEEAIECYRVITGACAAGTKQFVISRLKDKKDKYTIGEIIKLTAGEYQSNTFKKFFNK